MLDINVLPDDIAGLKSLVLERHAASQTKDLQVRERDQQIEHLEFQLASKRQACGVIADFILMRTIAFVLFIEVRP